MFRWKRGLLHALIPFGLAVAGGLVLLLVVHPADPEKLGEGVGRFGAACFVAGLGISYLAQTGRKKAALTASLALVAGVGTLVALLLVTMSDAKPVPTARDRAPLLEVSLDGKPHLKHPTLGFTLLRPPAGYHESPAMAAAMGAQDPGTITHAYAEDPPRAGLVVSVLFGVSDLRESVRDVKRGLESAMASQAGPDAKIVYARDDIAAEAAHLHAVVNNAIHIHIDAYALHDRDAVAMIMAVAGDATTLVDVVESYHR